jgi:hypothetical protein
MDSITPIKFNEVERKIVTLRAQQVILDRDVATLYDVETKRINEAVKNNPDKFPSGYLLEVSKEGKKELVENFDRFNPLKHSTVAPVAFTEKGLYMLATILKSPQATQTTIAIVETYARIRELARTITELSGAREQPKQKTLMQKSSEIIADILGDDMQITDTETSLEINFALMKFKHTVRQKKTDK